MSSDLICAAWLKLAQDFVASLPFSATMAKKAATHKGDGEEMQGQEKSSEKGLSLTFLNNAAGKTGEWEVGIFAPNINNYTYTTKSGQLKHGATFRCLLVSLSDSTEYVSASIAMRSDNRQPLEAAQTRFKEDLKFRISKVAFVANAKQEFLNAPIKKQVDLAKTKNEPMMQTKEGEKIQATPAMSIKDCTMLQQSQRFDVTALFDSVSEIRAISNQRQVVSVTILDDSGDDGKPAQLTFAFYMNVPLSTEATQAMNTLKEAQESEIKPVFSFFSLQGKKTDKGYIFEANDNRDFFIVKAMGPKAERLTRDSKTLQTVPQEGRDILEQASYEGRDYDKEEAKQSCCKILADLATAQDISEPNTLWQANWVEVGNPTGDSLLKKDQSELWFQVQLRDHSGSIPNIWMNQASALSLSKKSNKEDFLRAYNEGDQMFPMAATIKVVREAKASKEDNASSQADESTSAKQQVNLVIVQADHQPFNEAPTQGSLELISLIRDLKDDTSTIFPAALHMIQTSHHYALTVSCTTKSDGLAIRMPCQKVLVLVQSSKKTETSMIGGGFRVMTPDVEDLLAGVDARAEAANNKYNLEAMCTLENLAQYRLDPVRGKPQQALVTITNKTANSFIVESIQLLSAEEADEAKQSLAALLHMAIRVHQRDRKRQVEWNADVTPMKLRKCRRLGRFPTDELLIKDLEDSVGSALV